MERPVFHVVENNPHTPQPSVLTEAAICLRDAIRAAGHPCEHVVNRIDPGAWSIVLGGSPALEQQWPELHRRRCAIFNFEPLDGTSNIATVEYRQWLHDWLVLDCHASNIEVLRSENGPGQQAFELPIVPDTGFASAWGRVVHAFEALGTRGRVIEDEPAPLHAQDVLTDEEIEAILAAEDASPPQPDQELPKLNLVKREPGATRLSRWIMWVAIALTVLGGLRYWFAWKF